MSKIAFCFCFIALVITQFIGLQSNSWAGDLHLSGNVSLWWTAYEENENGILQPRTLSPAADVTSGFNFSQGRLNLDYQEARIPVSSTIQIRLEERLAVFDGYVKWCPSRFSHIYIGQMKVPATYESLLISDSNLDFISRSNLSKNLTDWSLSRSPYYSALYGNNSYNRDMGVGIKGAVGDLLSYFAMIGNGLGANLFIGGNESKEFMFSNNLGDYFYGTRMDLSPVSWLSLGGHYSINRHENMLFNDKKTVYDLDRYSWSVDSRAEFQRISLVAMYGAGAVNDDYFYTAQQSLNYYGYEAKCLFWIIRERLQIGIRYDSYVSKCLENCVSNAQNNLSLGANFTPAENIRLQINYVFKTTDNQSEPDLDDNILFLNFQYSFNVNRH